MRFVVLYAGKIQKKLAYSFPKNKKSSFWSDVRKLKSSSSSFAPVVDRVAGGSNIANVFASKLEDILNTLFITSHLSSVFHPICLSYM